MQNNEFLLRLLKTNSPSGYEMQASELFVDYLSKYCDVTTDILYNSVATINGDAETKILIDAHIDEIGMQVTQIHESGYLFFRRVGGVDPAVMPGTEVVVLGGRGEVPGIIGKKSIHLQTFDEFKRPITLNDLCIDIGVDSAKKAKEMVSVGDYITIKPNAKFINNDRIVSKALDNKIGVFVLSEVMKQLSKEKLGIGVYGVASAQEEVGSKGIKIQANKIKPNYSICIDVIYCSDMYNAADKGISNVSLGAGVGVVHSTDCNVQFIRRVKEIAVANNIPFQPIVPLSPTGCNNTGSIQLSNDGVITCLLSVPCRYLHTPVEMCDMNDVQNAIALIKNVVLDVDKMYR